MPRPSWERRYRDNRGATEAGRDRSGKQWVMAQMLCERLAAKHEFAVALLLPRSASGSSFSAQENIPAIRVCQALARGRGYRPNPG